jgi:hypothetical protein
MEAWRATQTRTSLCAIVDHGASQSDAGLQALERDGIWTTSRMGQQVTVLTGIAWVTHSGHDFILEKGDRLDLGMGADRAVVSGLNRGLMVLEVAPSVFQAHRRART